MYHSVSCGVGLPAPAQMGDMSLKSPSPDGPWLDEDLKAHLKSTSLCNRISQALVSSVLDEANLHRARERLPLYTILNHEFVELESNTYRTPRKNPSAVGHQGNPKECVLTPS